MILHLFPIIFWTILATLAITPFAIHIAVHIRLIDEPYSSPHKVHQEPVPKAGGLVIGVVLTSLIFLNIQLQDGVIRAILLPSTIIFIFGLLDDARKLSPAWKLLGQILGTAILISQGVYIRILGDLIVLNIALTLIWVVGITNAFNFVDSMDGLAAGLSAIASAFFMLVTIDAGQSSLSTLSAILLGSSIGILYFNSFPARTFLGDSGSQYLGFILAVLGIAYTPPGLPQPSSWFVPILLLGVPIFDTGLVVITRISQKRPFYQAGLDHTYHRLVDLGLPPSRAVMAMHLSGILCGCLAFIALPMPPLLANLIFAIAMLTGLFILFWFKNAANPWHS